MNEVKLTLEQQEELTEMATRLNQALYDFVDVVVEIVNKIIEKIKEIGIQLGRFFLKAQLLEWKIPNKIANYISKNIYWYWAVRLGFNWFQRKFALTE